MFAIQAVEVPLHALETIDTIVYQVVCTAIGIGAKQGPVSMLQTPTRRVVCALKAWLTDLDRHLWTILPGRVEDARLDCGIECNVDGTIFFDCRIQEVCLYARPGQVTPQAGPMCVFLRQPTTLSGSWRLY